MSGLISVGSLEGIGNLPQSVSAVILNPYPPLIKIPAKDTIVATVLQVKQLMDRGRKIVVHCTHGTDRTGLVIGAYRIIVNSWTFEEVQAERDVFGANAIRDIVDAEIVEFLKQLKV
jgi:protein tyrosine/serine phosphatase